jgi:AAA+ superfamily predicted ATPase
MTSTYTKDDLFERRLLYPDPDCQERLSNLVGLDEKKARLAKLLGLLVNPSGLRDWAQEHHPGADQIVDFVLRRPPLIVLAGDVGSGKTELAETIGDAVARQEKIQITLLPLSLATRGRGRVGEMTQMLSSAFNHTVDEAKKVKSNEGPSRGAVVLLVDEADSIAQSRESDQMHHEDRAGVNTFIRGIDRIGNSRLPAAVIMCTNRPRALDPAIKRRAADILTFSRPDSEQRLAVLSSPLQELGFSSEQTEALVAATGPNENRDYGYTFSDLSG